MVDTQEKGKEFHEDVEDNVEMHPEVTADFDVGDNRSRIGCEFKNDKFLETTPKVVVTIEDPIEHEERFQILKGELVDNLTNGSFFAPMDEVEFEDRQSSMSALQIEEKTKRRHDMVIFAYEPD